MRSYLFTSGVIFSSCLLSSCLDFKVDHPPFPIQEGTCDFFDKTEYMREYWIGISEKTGYPDVKIRIPSEYMDWLLTRFKKAGRSDGAIGFGIRPLDFAPSQGYSGVMDYPDGPIDPAKENYKHANGGFLIKQPYSVSVNTRMFSLGGGVSPEEAESFLEADFIAQSLPVSEAKDLLSYPAERPYNGKERLFYAEGGKILIRFSCWPRDREKPGEVYDAGCSMYSNHGPVGAVLDFDRDFLPEWRRLWRQTGEMVACMIVDVEKEGEK